MGSIEMTVDVTGRDGTIRMLLGLLEQADMRIKQLKGVAVANGQSLDDPVSGEAATLEDGTVNSYRHQINQIHKQRERLTAEWPDEMADVLALVEENQRKAEARREASGAPARPRKAAKPRKRAGS